MWIILKDSLFQVLNINCVRSPRAWYEEINPYLLKCGFQISPNDATLYIKFKQGGNNSLSPSRLMALCILEVV